MEDRFVAVVGGVNVDIGAQPFAPLTARDSNPGRVRVSLGGVGRNVAHNLRLLGVPVRLYTALGGDAYGAQLARSCAALGIDLSRALRVPDAATSVYLFVNDERGDMALAVSDMGICDALTPDYLAPLLPELDTAAAVVLDANLPEETIRFLCDRCAAPLFADPVSTAKAVRLRAVLPRLHTLKPNRLEAEVLSGGRIADRADAERAVRSLLARGVCRVFLSLGAEGVLAAEGENLCWQSAAPASLRSATGAGDAMTAALVWAYLRGEPLPRSAALGAAAGAVALESEETISPQMSAARILARSGLA